VSLLLLVEDDVECRTALVRALSERGHVVLGVPDAMAALRAVLHDHPDLVLLHLVDDLDIAAVLKMLHTPTIVIGTRDAEPEIVRLLDAGADDYLVRPFGADYLDAHVRAVLRRAGGQQPHPPTVVGGLHIDARARVATLDGGVLDLTRLEFELLLYLARRPGEVVSRQRLLTEIWCETYGGSDKTVNVHLSGLRGKLGESAGSPRYLHSVRGVGVKLLAPMQPAARSITRSGRTKQRRSRL
jgi:two-component system, OmpR family, KDP operon response regulator KdpE